MRIRRSARRSFLKEVVLGAGVLSVWRPTAGQAAPRSDALPLQGLDTQIGFELFTVANLFTKDPDGTLAALAAMGIREVQPRNYGGLSLPDFRALIDRHGLTCHSTHEFSIPGPGLERDLEALAAIGIRYARFPAPGEVVAPARGRGAGAAGAAGTAGRAGGRGGGRSASNQDAESAAMLETPEFMKRVADDLNQHGRVAKKFGVKALYHNHTTEFQRYPNEPLLPYEVLLKNTDPDLVAMEIDIGWASVAGQDVTQLFTQHPGRFELWHIKDAVGMKHLPDSLNQVQRRAEVTLVPVGLGEVDYKRIFTFAKTAGLRHFYIEQDNAAAWGDAMAATRVSVDNLKKILS